MNEIWANRLIAGTKTWEQCVKSGRAEGVKEVLTHRVISGEISVADYVRITGTEYGVSADG